MPELILKPLPPKDAMEAFKGRELLLSGSWQDLWHEEHAQAFTVARVASMDLLQSIHEELGTALEKGLTKEQFKKAMVGRLQAEGWLGEASRDAAGAARLARPGRLDLIYDANLRVSHAAGQWGRIERMAQRFPYLRYSTMNDGRVRPQHRAWEGITLPVNDPFWDAHMPPNGWRCRCSVSQWSQGDLDREGFKVTTEVPPDEMVRFVNKRTGEVSLVPKGIDPGWAYNPGKAGARAENLLNATNWKLESFAAPVAKQGIADLVQSESFAAWFTKPQGNFPVLRLDAAAVQSKRAIAVLSPESLAQQAAAHPNLALKAYRILPRFSEPDLILREGDHTLLVVRAEGQLWSAVVKAPVSDQAEPVVISFSKASTDEISSKIGTGKVLLDTGGWRG